MKQNKKSIGGTEFFIELMIAVFIVVMIAFALAITSASIKSSSTVTSSASVIVTNETGYINQTGYILSGASAYGFNTPVLTALYNRTSGLPIVLANASISAVGIVTNATVIIWNNASISYTYNYDTSDRVSQALINNYTSGLTSVATYVPTWLILGGLVVVIGIIVTLILVIMKIRGVATQESYAM